jgi:hypothetical protein
MIAIVSIALLSHSLNAQNFDNPATYMSHINKTERELSVKYLSYMSAASHGKSAKKIEKRREALVNSIYEVRVKIYDMPSFNGDKSLRDSAVSYLKLMYSVFNEDYSKIVNMEEIAEQSYDNMEAYLLAQQKAGEKLRAAHAAYAATYTDFASKNKVKLVDSESELEQKLETIAKVTQYHNEVYLTFFKAYKQEMYLQEALKEKNTNAIEQNRNALIKYSTEGIEKFKQMKGYNSDRSLETLCRKTLEFYKNVAENSIPKLSDFLLKAENFEQLKKSFDRSSQSKEDVDGYNKAVSDLNRSAEAYNKTNEQIFAQRSDLLKSYEASVKNFMDTYMPYK